VKKPYLARKAKMAEIKRQVQHYHGYSIPEISTKSCKGAGLQGGSE